jgi:SlyX protein
MNDRIVELETKVAFQEQALGELSDALARQQKQIEAMEKAIRELRLQFTAAIPSIIANASEETPPPHY